VYGNSELTGLGLPRSGFRPLRQTTGEQFRAIGDGHRRLFLLAVPHKGEFGLRAGRREAMSATNSSPSSRPCHPRQ